MLVESIIAGHIGVTVFLVISIALILRRLQAVELKLIVLGLFMAIGAVLYGMFSGAGGGFRAGPGPAGELAFQTGMFGGGLAGSLMKIAVILILAGLALLFLGRLAPRATSQVQENLPHENQP